MRLDPTIIKHQIDNLLVQFPELAEDEVLRADMIEGETDAFTFLSMLVRKIGEDKALSLALTEYVKDLCARADRVEHRVEFYRNLAYRIMEAAGLKRAELPEATLSIRNGTPKVIITDEEALPDIACRFKREPDKTKIKELLQTEPFHVAGAVLSNSTPSLSIRIK